MNATLNDALLEAIHAENLARYAANAATPYVHEIYAHHEARIERLVDALADGDDELARRFADALHDITFDGLAHMRRVFDDITAELAADEEEIA